MIDACPLALVPHVRTRRLLLRELRTTDFDAFAANLADPVATEHLERVDDRRHAWRLFAAGLGYWALHGAGWWGVELVSAGHLVGTVGAFFREDRPRDLELGWTMYRPFWGQGFATEAATGAVDYALERHGLTRAIAHVSPPNLASIRVAEKLGMRRDGEVDLYGHQCVRLVLERDAPRP